MPLKTNKKNITMKKLLSLVLFGLMFGSLLNAQTGIKGTIVDEYGEPLVGATIHDKTTNKAVQSDFDGNFSLNLSAGEHQIEVIFVSYGTLDFSVKVTNGKMNDLGDIEMKSTAIGIDAIKVIADRAKERETPVAFSNVNKKEINQQLGSRDIPLIMNLTPSVYATAQGGGAGDARINVRGFNQRNVSIMINGVPINDMENGWVYWSNWDGLADATSSIQMQRGMSAVNLATPSIGGTMNIITSPAALKSSVKAKFEYGSGNFFKTTLSANSGLINNKYAVSAAVVRKVGNGVIDATWTDAWAYYFGSSYQINKKQRLELFAMGAPQRHGQNLYKQNVAAYSTAYAKEIGADSAAANITQSPDGRLYNENWHTVSPSYTGQQWWYGKAHNRINKNFINERENYYHKPVVNLNWYSQWAEKVRQSTVFYYSGGTGGGSGTLGDMAWDYTTPSRSVDWDKTIAQNSVSDTAFGILRNSVNEQWTLGVLSRVNIHFSDKFKVAAGIDLRDAQIKHFREVRDLLGGKFYYFTGNEFDKGTQYNKVLGDKIAYFNTNTVAWYGYFAQAEYSGDKITAYGTFGSSYTIYSYTNHFRKSTTDPSKEYSVKTKPLMGYQIKGGIAYRPIKQLKIFTNLGYISKAPIFDYVIDDGTGTVKANPANELFEAVEAGILYKTLDNMFDVSANYYYTLWANRTITYHVPHTDSYYFISGIQELHRGFELQANIRPAKFVGIGIASSFANWTYLNNVTGDFYEDFSKPSTLTSTYYIKGLKVGDSPQSQFVGMLKLFPVKGLRIELNARHYSNYYANWDPASRTDPTDNAQVWKVPAYTLFDAHASYSFKIAKKYDLSIFGHLFNILNTIYVQDATDDSPYNGYYGVNNSLRHTANSAEVFLGLPRTFNVGMSIKF